MGLILGLEMSRLARSSKDWHHLLELCALCGTLLADQDGVYDPTDSNDRLLLGLKGTMSEFELFTMRNRLERGRLNKAERGEFFFTAPMGYVLLPSGELVKEPDEQARAVTQLIFDKFTEIGSAYGVLHYLVANGHQLGIRPQRGPQRGELIWRRPNLSMIFRTLHHPWYAGAYAYGRHATERKATGGVIRSRTRSLPQSQWKVLKPDLLPAYITWEQYQANQERLRQNRARFDSRGVPRNGRALLGGVLVCGACGRRLRPNYSNPNTPYYLCASYVEKARETKCPGLCSGAIDPLVVGQLFKALEPAALELSMQALADEQRERARLHQHWDHQRERARQDADRAARQFHSVEPENRLVGRTLEAKWEAALKKQHELEQEWQRFVQATPRQLSDEECQRITALSQDVKALWHAESTTPADRKEILRCLIERVVVHVNPRNEQVDVTIHWHEGFTSQLELLRPVRSYQQLGGVEQLRERIAELRSRGRTCKQIAEQLNQGRIFSAPTLQPVQQRAGLDRCCGIMVSRNLATSCNSVRTNGNSPTSANFWACPKSACVTGLIKAGFMLAKHPSKAYGSLGRTPMKSNVCSRLTARSKHGVCGHPAELTTPKPKP